MSRRAPFHVRRSQRARAAALVVALGLLASACSDDTATTPGSTGASGATGTSETPRTLRVPDDHPTVQSAVDAAEPGDLILLAPGTYSEAVTVEVPRVTIRGLDRNTVILDGGDERENGFLVFSDGVAQVYARVKASKGYSESHVKFLAMLEYFKAKANA